jgi:hypothetical protein
MPCAEIGDDQPARNACHPAFQRLEKVCAGAGRRDRRAHDDEHGYRQHCETVEVGEIDFGDHLQRARAVEDDQEDGRNQQQADRHRRPGEQHDHGDDRDEKTKK